MSFLLRLLYNWFYPKSCLSSSTNNGTRKFKITASHFWSVLNFVRHNLQSAIFKLKIMWMVGIQRLLLYWSKAPCHSLNWQNFHATFHENHSPGDKLKWGTQTEKEKSSLRKGKMPISICNMHRHVSLLQLTATLYLQLLSRIDGVLIYITVILCSDKV
jgi:hypothetical protein